MFFTSTALCFNSAKDSSPSAQFLSSSVTCLVSSPLRHLNFDATILGCCTAPESNFLDCETLLVWSFISNFSNFCKTRSNSEKAGSSNPLRRYMNSRDSYKSIRRIIVSTVSIVGLLISWWHSNVVNCKIFKVILVPTCAWKFPKIFYWHDNM